MDGVKDYSYIEVTIPLLVSLFTLMLMAFGARSCNHCKYVFVYFSFNPEKLVAVNLIRYQVPVLYYL